MNLSQTKTYYNTKPVEFVIKENYDLIENQEYVPRFSLKNVKDIGNIPINEPIKFSQDILVKAIKYGMIFLINYKGEKDTHFSGHERVIYPMVIGRSSKGKILIRGWHLNGWSVSNRRHINKIWRLFRADRILSMTFTGSFYRLPPAGYNANDKGMRGGIIAKADFNEIRRNQQNLINQNKIQNREEVEMTSPDRKFAVIRVKETDSKLDLLKPMENAYINNIKDTAGLRISFCKSIYGNKYVAILGALGQPGNTVKILTDKGNQLGVYKVLDSITGDVLKSIKNVKGNSVYDLYVFDKKI
ncbi:MAG: hypothetical protein E6R13_04375 [Spirochaetes bacterium]|nr:MAG: hypothetical protein E6R13_04375 [Spirochaetota bacterium]